jgi:hypothetical protein
MASAFEFRLEPDRHDFDGQRVGDDAPAHRKDVGIVVGA